LPFKRKLWFRPKQPRKPNWTALDRRPKITTFKVKGTNVLMTLTWPQTTTKAQAVITKKRGPKIIIDVEGRLVEKIQVSIGVPGGVRVKLRDGTILDGVGEMGLLTLRKRNMINKIEQWT